MSYTELAVDIGLAVATAGGILVCCICGFVGIACVVQRSRVRPREDSTEGLV